MYLDLLSQSNYISYNIHIAQTFGLQIAVYISELISILEKATRKKTLVDGYVFLDREYISNRTTICIEDQLDYDSKLQDIGVLEKRSVNEIKLDIKQLSYMITQEDEPVREEVVAIMKKAKRLSKKVKDDYAIDSLKRLVTTNCDELRNAYYDWIDCVFAKDGFMTKKAVTFAQEMVDKFSNRDLDKALLVLNVASINGYRDITWAINQVMNDRNNLKLEQAVSYNEPKKLSIGAIIE